MKIQKSIFIEAKEWFDKTYGNSYFSARISIDGKLVHALPFQYGYETQFEYESKKWLLREGYITEEQFKNPLWYLRNDGLDVYTVKYEAKQRDAKRWGAI